MNDITATKIYKAITNADRILIVPHMNPDGDALGSATAVMQWLSHMKKNHVVYCSTPLPTQLTFLNQVEKISNDKFRIKGEGQIYEANFNWVVEDGHNELKEGYEMTEAGAPEWGKFDFILDVAKNRENPTLTLILFEISVKDGNRQYPLPIVLF